MKDSAIYYGVGALLYCPANNPKIATAIISEKFDTPFSLCLCLEDTIKDGYVDEAENILVNTISKIYEDIKSKEFYLPKIFIRVREYTQIQDLLVRFRDAREIVTGFNLPKFSLKNADDYINAIVDANQKYNKIFYMMPIFESHSIINLQNRINILYTLKDKLDAVKEYVLNIRVGGNDLCHAFGFRRNYNESIHSISPISNIFCDIITTFGRDYVISGPVYEYYNGDNWQDGFNKELQEDKLCGFTGKTVIHPNQIAYVNENYKVSTRDFEDAKAILNWDDSSHSLVLGSIQSERMNEYKTHSNWALKIMMLAEVFGVKE